MTKDLVVLVADAQQETVVNTLLQERRQSLEIRAITFDIEKHPGKDSGVYSRGAEYCKDGLRRNRSSIVSTWRTPRTPICHLSRTTHQ